MHALTNTVESRRKVIRHQKYVIYVRDYLLRQAATDRIQCFIRGYITPVEEETGWWRGLTNKHGAMHVHRPYITPVARVHHVTIIGNHVSTRHTAVQWRSRANICCRWFNQKEKRIWNKETPHASFIHILMNGAYSQQSEAWKQTGRHRITHLVCSPAVLLKLLAEVTKMC